MPYQYMLTPKDILHYFKVYRTYIGYRLYWVFALSLSAALVEGFGITLVLPLLASLDEGLQAGMASSGLAIYISKVVDFLGISGSTVGIIAFIGLLIGVKAMIGFSQNIYGTYLSAQLRHQITERLFSYYTRMDYRFYTAHNTGHFTNVLSSQIPRLITSFETFKTLITAAVTTFGYLVIAILIDWRFALMACAAGGSVLILYRWLNEYVKKLSRRTATEQGEFNKFLVQSIQSYKYIAATASVRPLAWKVTRSIALLSRYQRNQGFAQSLTGALREPLSIGLILIVLIVQIVFFQAPLAPIFVSLILLYRAMGAILLFQSTVQNFFNHIGSLEMVEKEFAEVTEAQEPEGTIEKAPFNEMIRFDQVSFRYDRNGPTVLDNISLTIPAKNTVALVGPSGAGKSTIVDLLTLLLIPTEGSIHIDKISYTDIRRSSWRKQIGYVSQDTVIFDDTIANNIGLWQSDFDNDDHYQRRVLRAAEQANVREFIEALPEGFHTLVGDRGVRLSGGQKQRLFIARELFKQPRLLILDEATSALDTESEQAIQRSIENLKGQTTIVMIAHRLSTIKGADCVYVLENGRLVESGSYDVLISNENSQLSRLVALQQL